MKEISTDSLLIDKARKEKEMELMKDELDNHYTNTTLSFKEESCYTVDGKFYGLDSIVLKESNSKGQTYKNGSSINIKVEDFDRLVSEGSIIVNENPYGENE